MQQTHSIFPCALPISLGALALLLVAMPASVASGTEPAPPCAIYLAEATICPAFQLIGDANEEVRIEDVSGDGSTLVGRVVDPKAPSPWADPVQIPARWVHGELEMLGLPPGFFTGSATAVSRDGSVIAGVAISASFEWAVFVWRDGAFELRPSSGWWMTPIAASGDGQVLIGFWDGRGWRQVGGGDVEIWHADDGGDLFPTGISDAGDVIAGYDFNDTEPWLWIGDTSEQLAVTGQRFPNSGALGISPDGSVVVGHHLSAGALWRDGVFEPLPFRAVDASWEGLFLVGPTHFWDATGQAIEIRELLDALGLDTPAIENRQDLAMAYDGHLLVGRGQLPGESFSRSFVAVVSPKLGIDVKPGILRHHNRIDLSARRPLVVRVFGSEQADAGAIEPGDLFFGPARVHAVEARPAKDHNRDGHPDRDFLFDASEAGLALGDTEVCLAGVAEALPFRLCSGVEVVVLPRACGRGAELALVVPLAIVAGRRSRRRRAPVATRLG
jgi:hypothetical protein